jgi:hypothetical protein
MNSKKISFFALLLITTNCLSQDQSKTDITDIIKVTFLNPGISYEKRIGKFQSLSAHGFMNIGFSFSYSSSFGTTSTFYFDPALGIQYRYYYNAAGREAKDKRTEMNSLNYVSLVFKTIFSSHSINEIGLVWGLQRNHEKRFSLNFNLGPGYLFTKITSLDNTGQPITEKVRRLTIVGQLSLGFWINKRQ